MRNKRMEEKLHKSEAIDISKCERTADGDYILSGFTEGIDYCDADQEQWVWSIGELREQRYVNMAEGKSPRLLPVGTCLASMTSKFYPSTRAVECVWLR